MPKLTYKTENDVIAAALKIMERRAAGYDFRYIMSSKTAATRYLTAKLGLQEREHFVVLMLDTQNRLIKAETVSVGTIDSASVHPREIVKLCLDNNAGAVILAHNHPSGIVEPSRADREITKRIKDALALIDVRVLDHIIVGGINSLSFSEVGYL